MTFSSLTFVRVRAHLATRVNFGAVVVLVGVLVSACGGRAIQELPAEDSTGDGESGDAGGVDPDSPDRELPSEDEPEPVRASDCACGLPAPVIFLSGARGDLFFDLPPEGTPGFGAVCNYPAVPLFLEDACSGSFFLGACSQDEGCVYLLFRDGVVSMNLVDESQGTLTSIEGTWATHEFLTEDGVASGSFSFGDDAIDGASTYEGKFSVCDGTPRSDPTDCTVK